MIICWSTLDFEFTTCKKYLRMHLPGKVYKVHIPLFHMISRLCCTFSESRNCVPI